MPEILDKNLGKLQKLLSLMDEDTLTKEQFLASFQKVTEFVLKIQKEQGEAINRLEETYKTLIERIRNDHTTSLSDLKGQVNQVFVGERLKSIEGKNELSISEMKRIVNGVIDKKLREVNDRMSLVKDGPPGIQGLPGPIGPMPTEHLDLMKKMMAEMKKVQEILSNIPRGKAMGRAKVPMFRPVNLTSQQDGVARVFTIQPDTVQIFGGISSQFPFAIEASDISRSGNQITLDSTIAPRERGQSLVIFTSALFYP